ncbi:GNAT family N-acetyltransferase [Pleionea sp. CnH1-48]|uniref:GNAT family N-acetyltransferase n=1 Tax=Pleionea sp. CnH1-48 TaxID=2954494 RepID=UPI0020978524|nr:GNAT family N-acetyltransferase [Pleionea sp. CnH1-48]MCO7224204.1 GNAT family N-acetyltransferase [Pleionea sp. CnH1-48]
MNSTIAIETATDDAVTLAALKHILTECIEDGASVGFLMPVSQQKLDAFWRQVFEQAALDHCTIWVARDTTTRTILGSIQLHYQLPENQPHRAEIAKLLVCPSARCRGVGAALLKTAEIEAKKRGKLLLVLDTVTDSNAARLYTRQGWIKSGDIPDYAFWPDGRPCSTTFFYRRL